MLRGEDARRQIVSRVTGKNRYRSLAQDRTLVVFLGHDVHRGARVRLTAVQHGLVHPPPVHPRTTVPRQQGGMDVDDLAAPGLHHGFRDPFEEPRQDHEAGVGPLEGTPPFSGVGDIIEHVGRDPSLARHVEPAGQGPITHDEDDLRRGVLPEGAKEGRQIAASA